MRVHAKLQQRSQNAHMKNGEVKWLNSTGTIDIQSMIV